MDGMLIAAGALTGLLVGLTGVGGGALMTPLLLLVFGVAPLAAVGTDLWFAATTKLFATRVHHGHGLIDWQVVKRLWLGSLTASALTLVWMKLHPVDETAVTLLKTAIAAAVIVAALCMIFQKPLHALGRKLRTTDGEHFKAVQAPLTVPAGAVLGVLVTLTSVGAGALAACPVARCAGGGAAVDWRETVVERGRMTKTELDTLCRIAEAAGQEIMAVYRDGCETWQKDDQSPLTEADLRADRVIRQGLEQHFGGVFIVSEESVSAGEQNAERFFLVDPLDGTKEFLKRNDEFTANIALIENGEPVAGVVLAPALDELFYAARGQGAWKRDATGVRAIATAKIGTSDALRVMGSRSHGADRVNAWLKQLKTEHTFVAAGSSLKFCRIAEGQADIYSRFGPTSQRDTAAAQAVLEVAGGVVTDLQGALLRYGLDRPVPNRKFVAVGDVSLNRSVVFI